MITIKKLKIETTSFSLHLIAMILMLIDHTGMMLFPAYKILRIIGRPAFPIFAFMAVEGYFHTKSLKKYLLRLLMFAFISEPPYNIIKSGSFFDIYHQNVIWTLLIGIILIYVLEWSVKSGSVLKQISAGIVVLGATYLLGRYFNADYGTAGILTVLVFYIFRKRTFLNITALALVLLGINLYFFGGTSTIFGIVVRRQVFAVFALIPILLYKGKQGKKSKVFQYFGYAFYPLHMTALIIIYLLTH